MFLQITFMLLHETMVTGMMARPTFRSAYAEHVIHSEILSEFNSLYKWNDNSVLQPHRHEFIGNWNVTPDYNQTIYIVGAGSAGLSAAVLLHLIGFTNITVLEASSRIGGRSYTHCFRVGEACNNNYYDIGTMRIPLFQGAS